ncbi:MAG: hypothetical protein ACRBDL_11790 [Alphaproteobacteria bacterium]
MKLFTQVLCLFSVLFITSCDAFAMEQWRYRITVEVETPEGLKSGSAVWEVNLSPVKINNVNGYKDTYRGEAIAVDLGERGYLFALRRGSYGRSYKTQIVLWSFPHDEIDDVIKVRHYSELETDVISLSPDHYPLFVYLEDINDPKTTRAIYDPHNEISRKSRDIKVKNIEEVFGEGVRVKDVKIQMTRDPVGFGIHNVLPWLTMDGDAPLREKPNISTSQRLRYLDFQEGNVKDE